MSVPRLAFGVCSAVFFSPGAVNMAKRRTDLLVGATKRNREQVSFRQLHSGTKSSQLQAPRSNLTSCPQKMFYQVEQRVFKVRLFNFRSQF